MATDGQEVENAIRETAMTSHRPIAFRRTGAEKGKLMRSERYYGAMYRSFALRRNIDEAKAEARYADGVLAPALAP